MSIRVCIGNYGYYNGGELRDQWHGFSFEELEAWYLAGGDGPSWDPGCGGCVNPPLAEQVPAWKRRR